MKTFKFLIPLALALLVSIGFVSCGGGSDRDISRHSSDSDYSSNSDSGLSALAGTWELFQQGDAIGEAALFRMKISRDGSLTVRFTACPGLGQNDVVLADGSGRATLSGSALYVELTNGKGKGDVYQFNVSGNTLYTLDGDRLTHK